MIYNTPLKKKETCYNSSVISQSSLLHVYRLLGRQTSKEHSNLVEQVCTMIRRQVKLFPTSIKFDFRKLFNTTNNSCELEKYFDADLMQFVREITRSGRIMENRKKH